MIYLAYPIVLAAAAARLRHVGAFHAAGPPRRRLHAQVRRRGHAADGRSGCLSLQVDQITTDDPEGLAALLGDC